MLGTLGRVWQERRGFWLDVLPALLYLVILFGFGMAPLKSLPGPDFALIDKVWHLLAFAAATSLLARVALFLQQAPRRAAGIGALISCLLGALLEGMQSLTRYRSAELADLVADALGALLAYAILIALAKAAELPRAAGGRT